MCSASNPPAAGIATLASHELHLCCAHLCHSADGEWEQIQFSLGHLSIQTAGCYLDRNQRSNPSVEDRPGSETPVYGYLQAIRGKVALTFVRMGL